MIKKHNQMIAILFPLIYFLLGNNLSVHILEIEGEFENRYTTALNAVLGPESFRIEIQVIEESLKKKTTIPTDLPINILPGLGININSIPKNIESKENEFSYESIKSVDITLSLDKNLSDSLVYLAKSTIKNHILYKKVKNNLIINRTALYKTPAPKTPIINMDPIKKNQKELTNKSIIGAITFILIIIIILALLAWFFNKLYYRFIDFSESQLEGQDAVRLALEENLSSDKALKLEEPKEKIDNIAPDIHKEPSQPIKVNPNIQKNNIEEISNKDGSFESALREVGDDIVDAITNITDPITNSVKDAISESTSLDFSQRNPFDYLTKINIDLLIKIFNSQNPASSAIVLSYLNPKKSSEILFKLDVDIRLKIAQHLATMEGATKEVLGSVKKNFRNKTIELLKPDFIPLNGKNILSNILNQMNQEDSESILFSISQTNKTISEDIRKNIGYFNDILYLSNDEIQLLFNEVDTNTLTYSLMDCEDTIKQKILNSLPNSAKYVLERKIKLLDDPDPKMIEKSKQIIGQSILKINSSINNEL